MRGERVDIPRGVGLNLAGFVDSDAPFEEILSHGALDFLIDLHRTFDARRLELLASRVSRQQELDSGLLPDFLDSTREVREAAWRVASPPDELADRRVEITGPTDQRMTINALNSGARVWMADFEDSNAPLFQNLIQGQANLQKAIDRRIDFETNDGRAYHLVERPATIMVRPRGWHMVEKHLTVDGVPISASLFDFGLYLYHCVALDRERSYRPYFYLPKLENHLEARVWNEVFTFSEDRMSLARGEIRATVIIETVLAAFEMDEILFELRDHAAGLNAGRWDYLFSFIKKFANRGREFVLPDRNSVTMAAPFMTAYAELLVSTCHRRGIHAIGGMAAFVPSRRQPEINSIALERVREDKEREARLGFDGSWVAHPDLVATCQAAFDLVLADRPNQIAVLRDDVAVTAKELLDVASAGGSATADGLHNDVAVALRYLEAWLSGQGAVAIFNLMEDVATAEIARSQIWQWLRQGIVLETGQLVTRRLIEEVIETEFEVLRPDRSDSAARDRLATARRLLEDLVFAETFLPFLTETAYQHLN